MLYSNDFWTIEDDLGIAGAGDRLAKMVLEVDTPFTIGIAGKWGAGKTSVLRRAFVTLGGKRITQALPVGDTREEDKDIVSAWEQYEFDSKARPQPLQWGKELKAIATDSLCIWYSPWQHQSTDNPLIPLLLEIRAQFRTKANFYDNLKEINKRGGMAGLAIIDKLVEFAPAVTGILHTVQTVRDTVTAAKQAWEGDEANLLQLSDGQRFHILFEEAVESLLSAVQETENKNTRLVIFIDDLDRCEEKIVVRMLECIKLYLASHRCVFVLGIDDAAVLKAVSRQWQHRSEDDNREYLEKLFQAMIAVPTPSTAKTQELIKRQLAAHGFPGSTEPDLAKMISELLEPNPRKVKNFLNSLCATWQMLGPHQQTGIVAPVSEQADKTITSAPFFVLMHYLRLYHRPVWRLLEREPRALQVLRWVLLGGDSTAAPQFSEEFEIDVLKELFSRAFLHVLAPLADEKDTYRRLKLDDAAQLFIDRIDRKRSDDNFKRYFKALVPSDLDLPLTLLQLPDA